MYEGSPLSADEKQLERRRKLLEAIQQQAMSQQPSQVVSGRVVPYSPIQGATQLAQALMARKMGKDINTEEKSLQGKWNTGQSEAVQRIIEQMSGKPQAGGPLRPEMGDYKPLEPAVAPDPTGAAIASATDPYLQNNKALQDALIQQSKGGGSPYFTPFIGEDGKAYSFDNRAGTIEPLGTVAGKLDPTTQQNIAAGKETGKLNAQKKLKPGVEADIVTAKKRAEYEEANRQRIESMPSIITMAKDILASDKPTSSGAGTAFDYAASIFGFSPEGASAADQLRALGGALTSKMPRMEGPQSDRDTALYKEMAGRVGDSTLPIERRLAAIKIIEQMWAKPPGTPYNEFTGNTEAFSDAEKERRYQEWKARQ